MSAATATMATVLATATASVDIMKVCIPSCLVGILAGVLVVQKKGKELNEDPEFLEKMKDPDFAQSIDGSSASATGAIKPGAKLAVGIFGMAILLIIFFGAFPQFVPNVGAGRPNFSVNADGSLNLTSLIIIITLSASASIMLLTKTSPPWLPGPASLLLWQLPWYLYWAWYG